MKSNKILALIAGAAILFGIACSGIIIVQGIQNGEFPISPTAKENPYPKAWKLEKTKLEEFSDISVNLSYCDFSILPADGYYLEYRMDGVCEEPAYDVSDDSFRFQEGHTQAKYRSGFHFFFNPANFSSANQGPYYMNLYIPADQYFGLLNISCDSGNIEINGLQAETAEISADYGDLNMDSFSGKTLSVSTNSGNMTLGTIACEDLDISNEYGDITADSFQVEENTSVKLNSGSLTLSKLESGQLTLSNEYGDCIIDKITVKNSDISMDSGALKLRQATLGDTNITNEYGDTILNLANDVSDYNYDLNAEYGSVKLDGKEIETGDDGEVYYQKDNGKNQNIRIFCDSGRIEIR